MRGQKVIQLKSIGMIVNWAFKGKLREFGTIPDGLERWDFVAPLTC